MGLQYNAIDLSFVLSESIDQAPETDPSGTDQTLTRITFRTRAIIGPDGVPPATTGEHPGDVLKRVRHMLTQPRKRLVYKTPDGVTLVDTGAAGVDDANGPKVESFDCHQVLEGAILVSLAVTVRLTDCASGAAKPWLSNRWSESTSYDREWRCTKKRVGQLVLSGKSAVDPDGLRGLISPPVSQGFRRETADYQLDETNLVYRYTFVDREMMRPPPFPATRMTGRMVQHTPLKGGIGQGELTLKLSGPKGVPAKEMLNKAIVIAVNRVLATGPQANSAGNKIMLGVSVAESLDDDTNEVELAARWNIRPASGREVGSSDNPSFISSAIRGALGGGVGGITSGGATPTTNDQGRNEAGVAIGYAGWVGKDLPGSDKNRAISTPTRGTADQVRIIAAALNDPCTAQLATSELRSGLLPSQYTGTRLGQTTTVTTGVPLAELPDDTAALYVDDGPGAMEHWTLTSHYTWDEGVAVLSSTKAGEKSKKVRLSNSSMKLMVEFTASRVGGQGVIPAPHHPDEGTSNENVVFLKGTASVQNVDLAADGVNVSHTVSGVWEYGILDPSKVSVAAPVPPFLALSLAPEALKSAAVVSSDIVFPGAFKLSVTNVFTGNGVEQADQSGGTSGQAPTPNGTPRPDG